MADVTHLEDVATSNLVQELERRKKAVRDSVVAKRRAEQAVALENIDALLQLVPEHSRTSCSDDKPSNHNGRCKRCFLLVAKDSGWWDLDFKLEIDIYLEAVSSLT